mgnify:FL=1
MLNPEIPSSYHDKQGYGNVKAIFGLSHPVEDSQSENHLQIESDKENQGTRKDGFAASGLQLNVK